MDKRLNAYDDYFVPIPDLDLYFKRIGLEPLKAPVSLSDLSKLLVAHYSNIPFENLDVCWARKTPSLNTEDLFNKMVVGKRGGYCFEQNGLLFAVLNELGFDCYCVGIRIIKGRAQTARIAHRSVIIKRDGEKYFCDVGLGGTTFTEPVPFSRTEAETAVGDYFVLTEAPYSFVCEKTADGFVKMLRFEDIPLTTMDFEVFNFYVACAPTSKMREFVNVGILKGDVRYGFSGTELYKCDLAGNNKETVRTVETAEEKRQVLLDVFGIDYQGPIL